VSASEVQRDWLDENDGLHMIARYRTSTGLRFLGLFVTTKERLHVHVEILLPEAFGDEPPEVTHTKRDIERALAQLEGCELLVAVRSTYAFAKEESPKTGLFAIMDASANIRFTAATIEVRDATVDRIRWWHQDDDETLVFSFGANVKHLLDEDYIQDALSFSERALQEFKTGKYLL
jgi:hypothetical protein